MSGIIQLLPDHVANQIAAGEVVQRPASVVKELIENAVDSGATEIKLIIKDAGKTLIQVIDNGKGMNVTDARLCFERHATSKIRSAEDLFNLHTKGFRGEALASISAVAHVELKTKQEVDELGIHIIIEGSKFISQDFAVLPNGSSFLVKNLFFNIPARRNFLKSDSVELRHIIDEFHRIALTHPSIHFIMISNGAEVFNLQVSNFRQRIVGIFGAKSNEKLVPIEEETEIMKISGFVGKPEFSKKSKSEQFFIVNNRFIKSPFFHHAIINAYEGLLKESNQPSYFIRIEVPTNTIDINIHPTKTEVKFEDEHSLYAILRSAVKHALGMFNVSSTLDFEKDKNLDLPYEYKDQVAFVPQVQVDRNFNPFTMNETVKSNNFNTNTKNSGNYHNSSKNATSTNWEGLYTHIKQDTNSISKDILEHEVIVSSLFDNSKDINTATLLYQLNKKYVIKSMKSSLMFIHQNRAHQRILYEQFLMNFTFEKSSSQQLLFPLELEFSTTEFFILDELIPILSNVGFQIEKKPENKIEITGLPVAVKETEIGNLFLDLIFTIQDNKSLERNFSLTDLIATNLAKNTSIKSGKSLTYDEMDNLVNQLFACKEPNFCPNNRLIFTTISTEELDKKFL